MVKFMLFYANKNYIDRFNFSVTAIIEEKSTNYVRINIFRVILKR